MPGPASLDGRQPLNKRPLQVVVQTAFLGDLLLSIPLLKALREKRPDDRLGLVCREKLGEFFLQTGLVDEIYEIKKGDRDSYRRVVERLRADDLRAVYSPHVSFRTALFLRALKSPKTTTFKKPWNFFAADVFVPRSKALPDPLRQLSLLAPEDPVLAENLRQYEKSGRAFVRDEKGHLSTVPVWASTSLRSVLDGHRGPWTRLMERLDWKRWDGKPKAVIFPGSVWATKRWTEEGFVEVGRRLTEQGAQVLVAGAGNEVELAERVASRIPGAASIAGKTTLFESALVLAHSDVMIGNDSASIHLASVTETPLVTIFGPTVIEFGFRPWSDQAYVAEKKGLACRPCGPHGHKKCPRGTHECMKDLSADEIFEKARTLIP